MHVARHSVRPEAAGKLLEVTKRGMANLVQHARAGETSRLPLLSATAAEGAADVLVSGGEPAEAIRFLRLAGEASSAMWSLAESRGAGVDIVLGGAPLHLEGAVDESTLSGFAWLRSFWLATVLRDAGARGLLLGTQLGLTGRGTHTQTLELCWIEALRRHARGEDAVPAARQALEALRPVPPTSTMSG